MFRKFDDYLHDNDLTGDELSKRCYLSYMDYCDVPQLVELMTRAFGVETTCFAYEQLIMTRVMLRRSVKLMDAETGDIYGFLILSNYSIREGSPIRFVEPVLDELFANYTQIHGYAFVLDKRLRNKGLDKEMIDMVLGFTETFDFTWLAVDAELRSHAYWKRMGFRELFKIPEATFYGKFSSNVKDADIYYKLCFFNSEDHIHNREARESSHQHDE